VEEKAMRKGEGQLLPLEKNGKQQGRKKKQNPGKCEK